WRYRAHRLQRVEIGLEVVYVLAAHLGEPGVGTGGIHVLAVLALAFVHCAVEILPGPVADAGDDVRRDVAGIDGAEGRLHRVAAREGFAALGRVAGDAIAGVGQVPSALDVDVVGIVQVGRTGGRGGAEQGQPAQDRLVRAHDVSRVKPGPAVRGVSGSACVSRPPPSRPAHAPS